jgi:hypothetical protein
MIDQMFVLSSKIIQVLKNSSAKRSFTGEPGMSAQTENEGMNVRVSVKSLV